MDFQRQINQMRIRKKTKQRLLTLVATANIMKKDAIARMRVAPVIIPLKKSATVKKMKAIRKTPQVVAAIVKNAQKTAHTIRTGVILPVIIVRTHASRNARTTKKGMKKKWII